MDRLFDEFVGTPLAPSPAIGAVSMPQTSGVFVTLDRQQHGGTTDCPACLGNARVYDTEFRARFERCRRRKSLLPRKPNGPVGGEHRPVLHAVHQQGSSRADLGAVLQQACGTRATPPRMFPWTRVPPLHWCDKMKPWRKQAAVQLSPSQFRVW